MPDAPKSKRTWLPNLLTTGTLFCGFYAVVQGLDGQFERAALAVLAAAIFDGLDGRVARAMNAVSEFGKEYDSLADFLAFGMAPAIVCYQWALGPFKKVGWAAAFLFTVCGALRLARFNVAHYQEEKKVAKRYFQGLPIPMAAIMLAVTILFYSELGIGAGGGAAKNPGLWRLMPLLQVYLLGILMVSNIRFRSFKDFSWHRQRPFLFLVAVAILLTVLTSYMELTLFLVSIGYLLSAFHSHPEYKKLLAEGEEEEEDEVKDLSV